MPLDVINWMGSVDDSTKLSDLTIPGTHNSAATVASGAGNRLSTQVLDLRQQLDAGVRFLDIRARYIDNEFRLSHENTDLGLGFDDALKLFTAFLAEHPRETIIMSLKEEGTATGNDDEVTFEQRFDGYVAGNRDLWFLRNEIPTLAAVRGKIVLFRRFDAKSLPKGINAQPFEYNDTFTIEGPPKLTIQDEFRIPTRVRLDSKWSAIESLLDKASGDTSNEAILYVNFTSGAGATLPRTFPRPVAEYINPRLDAYFIKHGGPRRFGAVVMDFAEAETIARIVRYSVPVNIQKGEVGYWVVGDRGAVDALGSAVVYPVSGDAAAASAVAIAATPTGSGYWILTSGGKVYAHGQARNVGEGVPDGANATSMAVDPTSGGRAGFGYWILVGDGRVRAYGAAHDHGGIEPPAGGRAVSIVSTPDGRGYWILTSDGAVHVRGNAVHFGDDKGTGVVAVAMAATRDGGGYWVLSANGAVTRFGNAVHYGEDTRGGARAIAATQDGGGYLVLYGDGNVRGFGSGTRLSSRVAGMVGIAVDNNYFFFRSKLSGLVVDAPSPEPGTGLIVFGQKTSGNIDNQLWMFVLPSRIIAGYDFIASKQTGLFIEIERTDKETKRIVAGAPQTPAVDDQLWHLDLLSSDHALRYVYIKNRKTGEVIDIQDENPASRAALIAYRQRSSGNIDNQLWVVTRYFGYYPDRAAKRAGVEREQAEVASASPSRGKPAAKRKREPVEAASVSLSRGKPAAKRKQAEAASASRSHGKPTAKRARRQGRS